MKPIMKEIVIHCKPAVLNIKPIKNGYLNWNYSKQFGKDEIDVILVDDSDLDDEELCELNDINYQIKFTSHNFKSSKAMRMVNLNQEKINKISNDDLKIINSVFCRRKDLLESFNYRIIEK